MTVAAADGLRERFLRHGALPDCPIWDLHGHWGPAPGLCLPAAADETADALLRRANVELLVFCHHAALFTPDIGNDANIEAVRARPQRLRAYCGINPNYPRLVSADLERFDDYPDVFVGFKLLADYHHIPIDAEPYRPVWERADARGLPVLAHTWGGSPFDGFEPLRRMAERYPNAPLLLGHSIHGDWDHAVELARCFPNVYLELTAVLDERGVVERFVAEAGSEKVIFGTDFPWFSCRYCVGAVLEADMSDDDRHNILHRNAKRILSGLVPGAG